MEEPVTSRDYMPQTETRRPRRRIRLPAGRLFGGRNPNLAAEDIQFNIVGQTRL